MRRLLIATLLVVALAGCGTSTDDAASAPSEKASSSVAEIAQADLEEQLAGSYTADDPATELTVTCEGAVTAEVGATQDCLASTGKGQDVGLHVVVTDADEPDFDLTPFLSGDQVAQAINGSLEVQGKQSTTVCDGELLGEKGATTTCTVTQPEGETPVTATVTGLDGLTIDFDFKG